MSREVYRFVIGGHVVEIEQEGELTAAGVGEVANGLASLVVSDAGIEAGHVATLPSMDEGAGAPIIPVE